jgi:hypothetical protein
LIIFVFYVPLSSQLSQRPHYTKSNDETNDCTERWKPILFFMSFWYHIVSNAVPHIQTNHDFESQM